LFSVSEDQEENAEEFFIKVIQFEQEYDK